MVHFYVVVASYFRQEPTSLYGLRWKTHIWTDWWVSFVIVGDALAKVETIRVLACKVSFIFIEIDLVAEVGDIIGSYFMGGEITNCLFRF
jgi:hypothetical protein